MNRTLWKEINFIYRKECCVIFKVVVHYLTQALWTCVCFKMKMLSWYFFWKLWVYWNHIFFLALYLCSGSLATATRQRLNGCNGTRLNLLKKYFANMRWNWKCPLKAVMLPASILSPEDCWLMLPVSKIKH